MLDFINSQDREGLIKLGKKYKIIGHLSNFTSPYLNDDQIRLSVIKEMELEEQIQSQSGGNKNRSLKKKYAKKINTKRLSKKQRDYENIDNNNDRSILLAENPLNRTEFKAAKDVLISYDM